MWLYIPGPPSSPSTSSPSAQAVPDLISASSWQFQMLEQSAWWRGKPSQSRHWFQRWNKVSFIKLLCGAMPEPSTADHGVAQWTASLVASRASLTASPAESREATTPETSGQQRAASSSSRASGSSLLKMSAACSRRGLTKSLARSAYSETFTSLVSRLREDCSRRRRLGVPKDVKGSSSSQWPAPAARDWKGANSADHLENGVGRLHLDQLPNFVQFLWRAPQATDAERGSNGTWQPKPKAGQHSLRHQVETYPFSRRDPEALTNGGPSLDERRTLNPLFVEWLMGWPPAWTLVAWTEFACSETELSHFKQRMRSALLQLGLPREAPPAQLALFG